MRIVGRLAEIGGDYDALFCDVWGVVHDGAHALAPAVEALRRYREGGGRVVLVTNSPRTRIGVEEQLVEQFGVPRDAWDDIATSGDSARTAMYLGAVGRAVHHMGGQADEAFFHPPEVVEAPVAIERVPLDRAEGIVCTSPPDPLANPEALRPQLLAARTRGLKLLCANPDIVVDRGPIREWCAGAVAALYAEMGGESLYFGKPHPPIYDLARRRLARHAAVDDGRILCVGDGAVTDARGAMGEDLDLLFVAGGLAARETGTPAGGDPDPEKLARFAAMEGIEPAFVIGHLR